MSQDPELVINAPLYAPMLFPPPQFTVPLLLIVPPSRKRVPLPLMVSVAPEGMRTDPAPVMVESPDQVNTPLAEAPNVAPVARATVPVVMVDRSTVTEPEVTFNCPPATSKVCGVTTPPMLTVPPLNLKFPVKIGRASCRERV